jgi:hypothetical protein
MRGFEKGMQERGIELGQLGLETKGLATEPKMTVLMTTTSIKTPFYTKTPINPSQTKNFLNHKLFDLHFLAIAYFLCLFARTSIKRRSQAVIERARRWG